MRATPYNPASGYQPESKIDLPALYRWPLQPLAMLKYLLIDLLLPWGCL
jgi:hypothetical protein